MLRWTSWPSYTAVGQASLFHTPYIAIIVYATLVFVFTISGAFRPLAVLATMRVPRRSALLPKIERFMGFSLAPRRALVITNRRVLLPRSYAEGDDWVDVSLDRRQVRVLKESKFGRLASLDVTTALGRQIITTSSEEDAARLKRALGGL